MPNPPNPPGSAMPQPNRPSRGSSLITTLLVITVLTIIVVAFLQSMSIERMTARSYANIEQARLAAEAGVNYAQNLLENLYTRYPDSATAWLTNLGRTNQQGTVFFFRSNPDTNNSIFPNTALPSQSGNGTNGSEIRAWPLISGVTNSVISTNLSSLFPTNSTNTASVNLNRNGSLGLQLSGNSTNSPVVEANWVNLLLDPTRPNQPDPSQANYNPIIGRYAFVIEDESFKVNWNSASLTQVLQPLIGTNYSELSLSELLTERGFNSQFVQVATNAVGSFRSLSQGTPRTDAQLNQMANSNELEGLLRWSVSRHSSGLNLSRGGVKRLNLNEVVQDSLDPTEIDSQLQKITYAITHDISNTTNNRAMPLFGQRLHRRPLNATQPVTLNMTNLVAQTNAATYVMKVAANIRDYIDTDIQPTVVRQDGTVFIGAGPDTTHVIGHDSVGNNAAPNPYVAFGKEAGPKLMEVLWRVRLLSFWPPVRDQYDTSTGANFDFTCDYYFNFWNPTTRDITASDLGPDAFLEISDQIGWATGGGTVIPPGRPFRIPLANFVDGSGNSLVFRAGNMTVLTTDDRPCVTFMQDISGGAASVFRPDQNTADSLVSPANLNRIRRYQGQTFTDANDNDARAYWRTNGFSHINASRVRALRFRPDFNTSGRAGTTGSDYQTKLLLGNANGVIESFGGIGLTQDITVNNDTGNRLAPLPPNPEAIIPFSAPADFRWARGSSVQGNTHNTIQKYGSQRGDGRANSEAISIQKYRSGGDDDQFRTYQTKGSNNSSKEDVGFGTHLVPKFLNPSLPFPRGWEDYYPLLQTANDAPSFISDDKLQTIGELGNIYDPSRQINPNLAFASAAQFARGGGRSLFIGRPEQNSTNNQSGLWDGNQNSPSRNWTSWRLTDVFDVRSELELDGVINPNGFFRDGGSSLRAALRGLRLNEAPVGQASDPDMGLSDTQINTFITSLQQRLQGGASYSLDNVQPFWERGEISEVSAFLPATHLLGNGNSTLDRTLEQVAGRLIGLVEPKGNTFTIYAIGEKIEQLANGTLRSKGSSFTRRTIRFLPIFDPPLPASDSEAFSSLPDRFRPPARFETILLDERDF